MTVRRHTVIVGASAAGVSAAMAMRAAGYDGRISLVDNDPNLPYERPPLSKALLGSDDQPLRPIVAEATYAEYDIELHLGVRAISADRSAQAVALADGTQLKVTSLLLATGLAARALELPGSGLDNIAVLRDAADARRVRVLLRSDGPLVVIGAGFIGLEIAAAARELGRPVTVVEAAALPLIAATGTVVAKLVLDRHVARGVEFVLGQTVTSFNGQGAVQSVTLADGRRLPAAAVIVGVGVRPRLDLAAQLGVELDQHGIVVDSHGRSSLPWVFAAGDVASQPHPALATRGRIEHWDVALRHGTAVGSTIAGQPTEFGASPYAWSDQYGRTYQFFGRTRVGDEVVLRHGGHAEQFLALWRRGGRVVAVAGLDQSREVAAVRRLIDAGVTAPADVLASPATDLRALGRRAGTGTGT